MSKPGTQTCFLEKVLPNGVAVVTLDHFPVNSLHPNVSNGITQSVLDCEALIKQGKVKAVVLRGAGRCFCAGADISQFGADNKVAPLSLGRPSADSFGFEELSVPVVAAIHGFALGGGMELTLGCHYRVIAPDAFVGLPEVNIGLLPGAQGTQRLPRLVGAESALSLILSGEHVKAPDALKAGVVDLVAPSAAGLLDAAAAFALSKAGGSLNRISLLPPPAAADFGKWSKLMAAKRPGELAPAAIIACVQAASQGGAADFQAGVKAEGRLFRPLIKSHESGALRHMFFAERGGAKLDAGGALGRGASKTRPAKLKTVGIVGAGLMGGGIGMCCAEAGLRVLLLDSSQAGLDRGLALIDANFARSVKRGSKTPEFAAACRARMAGTLEMGDFADCDLVVEAVFEEIGIKKKIFAQLDAIVKPGAFLCSNTSALNIDAIAAATSRPALVMGTHFFSPANVMKLLENVRGKETSDLTVATMMSWGKQIGKWSILAGNCPGFVGNRMINFYSGAARAMCDQGALPEEVDGAARAFGFKMGPFAMADLVGLDLGIQAWKKAGTYDPKTNSTHALIEMGRKGQKTKAGWYDYEVAAGVPTPSAKVKAMLEEISRAKGLARAKIPAEEMIQRLLFPLINEGFKILEEGMAQRPADIDVCYVHGYGFPRVRGGPMHYADLTGLPLVKATLVKMGLKPANLLNECVDAGMTLAKFWAAKAKKAKL